jgi:hypothetical protein
MKQQLLYMIEELQKYKRDKDSLMLQYVQERLDKSFNQYDKELQQSIQFLTRKHEKSLIKRMKKLDGKPN